MATQRILPSPPLPASDTGQRTLTHDAYHRLRADIVCGRRKPGEKLRPEHLKQDYGVGAATMREALAMLIADNLVVSQQQLGFRVSPMSLADFSDLTDMRVLIECHAVSRSIALGDDEWEGNLSAAFHRLTRAEERRETIEGGADHWEVCNKKFHQVLVTACDSPRTVQMLDTLYRQSERYRRITMFNIPVERDVHNEHEAIFRAALNRDEKQAKQAIEHHIRATFDVLFALLEAQNDPRLT
jgi:GntR family transcriptional regulator, carbon starvation induced regulator